MTVVVQKPVSAPTANRVASLSTTASSASRSGRWGVGQVGVAVDVGQLPVGDDACGEQVNRAASNLFSIMRRAHERHAHRSSLKCPTDDDLPILQLLPTYSEPG